MWINRKILLNPIRIAHWSFQCNVGCFLLHQRAHGMRRKTHIVYREIPQPKFCTFFSLYQKIKVPTRVCSATIIDHVLASYPERVPQQCIIDVGLSGHSLILCTRKISSIKRGTPKQMKFRLFKPYSVDLF